MILYTPNMESKQWNLYANSWVWHTQIRQSKKTQKYVEQALEVGFRLFDTAQSYGNESGVGVSG